MSGTNASRLPHPSRRSGACDTDPSRPPGKLFFAIAYQQAGCALCSDMTAAIGATCERTNRSPRAARQLRPRLWVMPPPSPTDDVAELLAGVCGGDERAWNTLVEKFAGLVWSVARSFRLPQAVTEDIAQTVWLRFAEHCGRIRQPERLAGWLATSTRHEALRVIKQGQRTVFDDELLDRTSSDDPSAEESFNDQETRRDVLDAFAQLDEDDQRLLRLVCAVPPLDYKTIAELLGRSVGSIGPTRARALERLRRLLPDGVALSDGGIPRVDESND